MTQSLIIDPNEVRRPGYVKFPEVPVNQYTFDRDTEIARYGEKGMVQMLHDMIVVRTFESMLDSIKKTGAWEGVEYNHPGPAHLGTARRAPTSARATCCRPMTSSSARTAPTARSSPSATRPCTRWTRASSRAS